MVDFSNLNDIYHLSMIIIGFGMLALATITLLRTLRKDKQLRIKQASQKKLIRRKHNGKKKQ